MNKTTFFFIFIWSAQLIHAQNDSIYYTVVEPGIMEQIGLKITLKSKIISSKCGCEFNAFRKKICNLYVADIEYCLFKRDDSLEYPIGVSFFLIQSDNDTFVMNRQYLVTAYKSYYGYFIINQAYPLMTKFTSLKSGNVVKCCSMCQKTSCLKKILYKIGINRKGILEQKKNVPIESNEYWRSIQQYLKKNGSTNMG